ncbi:hypothetical protein VP01_1711g2 [Puccinia sorghi]|uniref:Uncharacterized protein n=1 Tax=Puccinia sorghi TaxID=27349 RepID=A0A0L6VFK1_9BASI|nr:hypothetical protein VP01_1711g2 [Puccinia sorghi]
MIPHASTPEEEKSGARGSSFSLLLTNTLYPEEQQHGAARSDGQSSPGKKNRRRTMMHGTGVTKRCQSRLRTVLLIGLLVAQSVGVIGFFTSVFISLDPYVSSDSDRGYQAMLGYLVIFTIATVFEVYIAVDSLLSQNAPQLFALCLFEASMTGFGAMLPHQIHKALRRDATIGSIPPALIRSIDWRLYMVPAVIGVATLVLSWLTWHFSQDFGWHAFKKLGANIALRRAMKIKSIFYMLQKFNFFFLIGFCVLIVQMRKQSQHFLQTLDVILPSLYDPFMSTLRSWCLQPFLTCAKILSRRLFASIAVELELRVFIFLYGIFWSAAMVFMGYEIIEIHPLSEVTDSQHSLILFSSLTLVLLFSTGIMSIFCFKNFNKGLKGAEDSYIVRLFPRNAAGLSSPPHAMELHHSLKLRAVLD